MPQLLRAAARWLPAIAWMAAIFWMSSLTPTGVPSAFSTIAHFTEYAVLAALLIFGLRRGANAARTALLAVLLAALYGATDELHQSFVPGRVPDVLDWVLDTAGATSAAVAWFAIRVKSAAARPRQGRGL